MRPVRTVRQAPPPMTVRSRRLSGRRDAHGRDRPRRQQNLAGNRRRAPSSANRPCRRRAPPGPATRPFRASSDTRTDAAATPPGTSRAASSGTSRLSGSIGLEPHRDRHPIQFRGGVEGAVGGAGDQPEVLVGDRGRRSGRAGRGLDLGKVEAGIQRRLDGSGSDRNSGPPPGIMPPMPAPTMAAAARSTGMDSPQPG